MIKKLLKILKTAGCLLLAILPSPIKILIYNNFMGCKIDKSAYIGLSYLKVAKIFMGPNSKIKHFSRIRNLELLHLEEGAEIGNFNKATAIAKSNSQHFSEEYERNPALILRKNSAIVNGHFLDCNNLIEIGQFSILAGTGSSFFTHGIDIVENKQVTAPIYIGQYCIVSSNCVVVKGGELPDYSILAANSTLHKSYKETFGLYSGVPASLVKKLPSNAKFFSRETGFVN